VLNAGWIQGDCFVAFGIQTKFEPLLFMHLKIVQNELEMRKLQPPKVKGVKN
jgi:hypothetical protein